MTRPSLIERLAVRCPQRLAIEIEIAVKLILEAIAGSLARRQRIEMRGSASLALNYCPPRVGCNRKSGDKVRVPGKHAPLQAGRKLRQRIRGRCIGPACD